MAIEIMNDLLSRVESALREHGVYADVYRDYDDFDREVMKIAISWGDWKHEHLRAKWVVEDVLGLPIKSWDTDVTESDGSDCYSAVHVVHFGEKPVIGSPFVIVCDD